MKTMYTQEQSFFRAEKRVKNIKGFYTHLFFSVFIIPFNIFLNLELSPEFTWYWFFIGAWALGLALHWFFVFGLSRLIIRKDWEQKKIREMLGNDYDVNFKEIDEDHTQELFYIKAKKKVKEIKGFYAHLIVTAFSIPMVIWVKLEFVPGFHFFWFAIAGMLISVFFHWLGVFGFSKFGYGRTWEERKIKELMKQDFKNKY